MRWSLPPILSRQPRSPAASTSQPVAMTAAARGNVPVAVFNATLSGLLGIALTPFLMGLVMRTGGQSLPMGEVMADLVLLLLLPLLVALGDREKRSGSEGPPPDGPAPATMDFIRDLAAHPGHKAQVHVLKGHVHIQTLAGSFPLALPFALAD